VCYVLLRFIDEGTFRRIGATLKVRKTTRRGGGLNCVFKNFSSLRSKELFSGSESEVVQSLSEFRVLVQRINVREQRKKEHK